MSGGAVVRVRGVWSTVGVTCPLRVFRRWWSHRVSPTPGVRGRAEIEYVRELFVATGDDSPAINTAVRDTLLWVLGGITALELMEHYLVTGADHHCFTCPARGPEPEG